jgi:DNA-binding NarL/FixJ family response regulator
LEAPSILVADDHPMYMEAVHIRLERLFPGALIVDKTSLAAALSACRERAMQGSPFNLALLDYGMPGVEGPAQIAAFIRDVGGIPVAVMSGSATMENALAFIRAGARGFLPKTLLSDQFGAAVHALLSGGTYLPTDLLDGLMGSEPVRPESGAAREEVASFKQLVGSLRPREREVLKLVAAGYSNKEIGRDLDIAEVTVKLHVRQILKRVGLRNRVEAAAMATKAGLD